MTEQPMPYYMYFLFLFGAWIYKLAEQLRVEEGTMWGWNFLVGIVGLVIIFLTGQHAFHKGQRIGFEARTVSKT